jgi:hypothetical protein
MLLSQKRKFANAIDDAIRRAYGAEYDGERLHVHLADMLNIGVSSWYSYLNANSTFPAALIGRKDGQP